MGGFGDGEGGGARGGGRGIMIRMFAANLECIVQKKQWQTISRGMFRQWIG